MRKKQKGRHWQQLILTYYACLTPLLRTSRRKDNDHVVSKKKWPAYRDRLIQNQKNKNWQDHCRQTGFTLIELLIALTIFAGISVMATVGIQHVIKINVRLKQNAQIAVQIQLAMTLLTRDLQAINPYPLKQNISSRDGPLLQTTADSIVFTTANNPNPAMLAARGAQRQVSYRLSGDKLIRATWPVASPTEKTTTTEQVILTGVEKFHLQFIDSQGTFHNNWPLSNPNAPLNIGQLMLSTPLLVLPTSRQLPAGIAIELQLKSLGTIKRLLVLADQYVAPFTDTAPAEGSGS